MKKLLDLDVEGRRVLLQSSVNVPLSKDGEILDDFRLRSSLATIQELVNKKAKVVIIGHLGRPEGRDEVLRGHPTDSLAHARPLGRHIGCRSQAIGVAIFR